MEKHIGYDVKLKKKVEMVDAGYGVLSNGMLVIKGKSKESGIVMVKIIRKATPQEIKEYGVKAPKKGKEEPVVKTKEAKKTRKENKVSDADKIAKRRERSRLRRLARKKARK